MGHDYKKATQLIGWLLLVIVVCFSIDLIVISGGALDSSGSVLAAGTGVQSAVISAPEQAQLSETLSELLLCGQWPITDTRLSEGRGNPFEPKKAQLNPLFMTGMMDSEASRPNTSCLSVREVLNK
jgi:hypothetical protein